MSDIELRRLRAENDSLRNDLQETLEEELDKYRKWLPIAHEKVRELGAELSYSESLRCESSKELDRRRYIAEGLRDQRDALRVTLQCPPDVPTKKWADLLARFHDEALTALAEIGAANVRAVIEELKRLRTKEEA